MFYIDFKSPEGKTYRIDLTEIPITYHCRVCGYEKLYMFNESDPTDWCDTCEEKHREEEKRKYEENFWPQLLLNMTIDLDTYLTKATPHNSQSKN